MPECTANPAQEQAIGHTAGAAQILAGPGSGKTYVIVHRIRHLITEQGIDPSHILVITFTKAAALEMQERFFRLMEPERPPVRFGTFHAVFCHILKQSAQYRDYVIITEAERRKLLRQIIHMHKRFACLQEEDMDSVAAAVSACKTATVIRPVPVQKITEADILFLTEEYAAYLREFGQMDFDDILCHCHALLTGHPDILARWQAQFQYILIDEFQDISPKQYEIIKLLAAPENHLFVVGDDDQSIYGFRGASPDIMRDFMQDYPDARRIFLDVNYRCNRQIVEAAGKVIAENRNRIARQVLAAHEDGAGVKMLIFASEEDEGAALIEMLQQKKARDMLDTCAVICRTNYDCAMWAQTLRRHKIPFMMKEKPKNQFRHFVIQDIMAYLALAQGELTRKHFLRIMNRPVRYLRREAASQERISEGALTDYYKDTPYLQERVRKFFRDLQGLRAMKPHLQVHYVCKVIGYDRYLLDKYGADKAREFLETAAAFQKFAKGFQTVQEMNDYISQCEDTLQEIQTCDKEDRGIRLMTMHASKGLEFDTVYLPDCQEGRIPSARAQTEEETEEERRMFYVAMTRARRELFLMAYKGKSGKDVPSRFLTCLCQSSSDTSSSNSAESRYSSNASVTASYSSSSSI